MIPKDIAGRLSQHIIEDAEERKIAGTSYIFRSRRYGYERAVIDSQPFVKCIRWIIRKYDICDENGELWHFTIKQFRKTLAVRLIENGATTVELAYWLGHLCSDTAAKYYAEVRKKKLAELNTEFFRSKFELIMTANSLKIIRKKNVGSCIRIFALVNDVWNLDFVFGRWQMGRARTDAAFIIV